MHCLAIYHFKSTVIYVYLLVHDQFIVHEMVLHKCRINGK